MLVIYSVDFQFFRQKRTSILVAKEELGAVAVLNGTSLREPGLFVDPEKLPVTTSGQPAVWWRTARTDGLECVFIVSATTCRSISSRRERGGDGAGGVTQQTTTTFQPAVRPFFSLKRVKLGVPFQQDVHCGCAVLLASFLEPSGTSSFETFF